MDSLQRGQVEMFVNITGASEAEARGKLQAFRGDLNAAIDSYLSERESSLAPVRIEEAHTSDWMDEDESPPSHQIAAQPCYALPSARTWSSGLPSIRGFGFEGLMASRSPYRGTSPFVTQPQDIREIPIDWKDEEPRIRSNTGLIIEEVPATAETWPPSQLHPHIVSNDEDVSRPLSRTFRRDEGSPRSGGSMMGSNFNMRQRNANGPLVDEVTDGTKINEGDNIEEEMLRAALEASQKDIIRKGLSENSTGAGMHGSQSDAEDDDFVLAVSLSLKTAEQEKALREGKGFSWVSELGTQDDSENDEVLKRKGLSSARDSFSKDIKTLESSLPSQIKTPNTPASRLNVAFRYPVEDTNEIEGRPSLRSRALNRSFTPGEMDQITGVRQEVKKAAGTTINSAERNGNSTSNEWGGLSLEEQEEAVMLEAAMFGRLPDDAAMRFPYPAASDGIAEGAIGSSLGHGPIQRVPSPSVIAQRLLREQQDDEYLASLVADREKLERAQHEEELRCLKEAEVKAAADTQEKLQREEELLKRLAEQELEKQKAAKRAVLPEEPDMDNDNAVTIMLRLPDGARQGRRFLKSEPLQCLINFIDVSCGPLPGSYQLVRPYPRRAYTDTERASSFQELGLNSKYETLFLEVI